MATIQKKHDSRFIRLRRKYGNQERVAVHAGISVFTLAKIERKGILAANPRLSTLLALCKALETTVEEMVK